MDNIPDVILYSEYPGEGFGSSISDAGDVNGDGNDDVIVGAYSYEGFKVGSKYCMLSGDFNMDGVIDLDDITLFNNNISNFKTGYINTDLNGDNMADINDILIAYNNSFDFVSLKRP